MSQSSQPTLLVTGASGKMGRQVVELLLEAQAGPVIAVTRTPEKLADFSEKGVIVRYGDFDDPASLPAAFEGADRLLLISTDVVGVPGKRLNQHRNAVKAAEEAGVQHVVYTSLVNPGPETPIAIAPDHHGTEEALAASTMGWTMLRNNIYADILIGTINQAIQFGGQLFSAAGDGKTGYVTREDCGRAAAAALASSYSSRRALDITGPEAITQTELAEIAASVIGQQITYVPLELEVLVQNMVGAGLPQPLAEAYASFDQGMAEGFCDVVSSTVEELTGRKPTPVAEFLVANRESLLQEA